MNESEESVSWLLRQIEAGDREARGKLFEVVYDELRDLASRLMQSERPEHTLQPTALVNEAAARLLVNDQFLKQPSRAYFFGAMAMAMRRVLVDHARRRSAKRRGSDQNRVPLDYVLESVETEHRMDLLAFDEAIEQLEQQEGRLAEVVVRRFYGGFEIKEIAEQLGVSVSTIEKDWRFARAWLRRRLGSEVE